MGVPSSFARVSPGATFTPTPTEPVSAAELKALLRVTSVAEDTFITSLCTRARLMAEKLTGRTIMKASWYAFWDFIPGASKEWWDGTRDGFIGAEQVSALELPRPPLISVTDVTSYMDDDSAVVMSASDYRVDAADPDLPGRVCLKIGSIWPVFTRPTNGFRVSYLAGYATVPEDIKHAILLMGAWLYKNRGDCSADACGASSGATGLLSAFRVMSGS